jgi:hypothetical protein
VQRAPTPAASSARCTRSADDGNDVAGVMH